MLLERVQKNEICTLRSYCLLYISNMSPQRNDNDEYYLYVFSLSFKKIINVELSFFSTQAFLLNCVVEVRE